MKKLFFITLFSIGMFAVSNAQVMTYTLNNFSGISWDFGMDDTGPSPSIYHNVPATSPPISGAIFPFFQFDLGMKTENQFNCGGYTIATGPGPGSIPLSPCFVPSGVVFNITTVVPFVQYNMDLFFF